MRRTLVAALGALALLAAGAAAATATVGGDAATTTTAPATTAPPPSTTTFPTTTTATTAATTTTAPAAGPVATTPPRIAGALRVGERLAADHGAWTAAGTIAYAYQWYRCDAAGAHCSSIHGATGAGYRTVAADLGRTIALTVKATAGGATTPAYASVVGPLPAATSALYATAQPSVSGSALVGGTVTAGGGAWQGATPTLAFGWERCNANGRICAVIPGATAAAYSPTAADVGHALVAAVTATAGSTSVTTLSAATPVVAVPPGPRSTVRPAVAGTAQQGKRLTASPGGWTGTGAISYAYQWYRCDTAVSHCSSIHGATARTYRLVAKDVGRTVALSVKAKDTTGTSTAYASALGPIAAASAAAVATIQPLLSGQPVQGQTLRSGTGVWTAPASAPSYGWLRCNANGRICAPIAGAAAITYPLTAEDLGHVVVAVVRPSAGGPAALSIGLGPVTAAS